MKQKTHETRLFILSDVLYPTQDVYTLEVWLQRKMEE